MTPTWVAAEFLAELEVRLPIWEDPQGEFSQLLTVDGSRASAAGLKNRPTRETARDTLAWWQTLPEDRTVTIRAGLPPDREIELLDLWSDRNA
jgi:2'-hydroxyisoflavone reductase